MRYLFDILSNKEHQWREIIKKIILELKITIPKIK